MSPRLSASTSLSSARAAGVTGAPPTTIGTVTVATSVTSFTIDTDHEFTVSYSGDAADAVYSWTVSPSTGVTISAPTADTTNISFPTADVEYTVNCEVTSGTSTDSPADDDYVLTSESLTNDFENFVWSLYGNAPTESLNQTIASEGGWNKYEFLEAELIGTPQFKDTSYLETPVETGDSVRIQFDIYFDFAETDIVSFQVVAGNTGGGVSATPGQKVSIDRTVSVSSSANSTIGLSFYLSSDRPAAGDIIYIKNLVVTPTYA